FGRSTVAGRDDQAREPPERWIEGAFARTDLVLVEGLTVAGDQRPHHGMFGWMRLQKADATALVAAGAPDHLIQQLPRAFGGARIAVAEAEISIDHADQIEPREVMALRDDLG